MENKEQVVPPTHNFLDTQSNSERWTYTVSNSGLNYPKLQLAYKEHRFHSQPELSAETEGNSVVRKERRVQSAKIRSSRHASQRTQNNSTRFRLR